jgi:hypothetical protein
MINNKEAVRMRWDLLHLGKEYKCIVVRIPIMGHLCGYVGVQKGHKYYGTACSDIEEIEVHGGITYGEFCGGYVSNSPGKKLYWIGFDLARIGDDNNLEYAIKETKKLAGQLARVKNDL